MKRVGFTLVELVIVLIVAAILSVAAILAISNSVRGIQLGSAADKLASDLKFAQTMASNSGTWYGVSFEVNPLNQYSVYTITGTVDTLVADPAKAGANFVVNVNTLNNVTIASVSIAGGKRVEFSPLGTPYADKNDASGISEEGVVTMSRSGTTRSVRITPNTGRVYIQ